MQSVNLDKLVKSLNELLEVEAYQDFAFNGLQIDSGKRDIERIAFSVDSGLSVIKKAVASQADLLIVHHGLMWGSNYQPVTGTYGDKVRLLIEQGCSLYAAHLPLDGHAEHGNGSCLARFLDLKNVVPFFQYKGMPIGAKGNYNSPIPLSHIMEQACTIEGSIDPFLLPFGKSEVQTVGVVTGSGSDAIAECAREGIDLLISGESKQSAYHEAREHNMNVLFVGHYGSETFGPRSLQQTLEKDYDISTVFIEEPTGI